MSTTFSVIVPIYKVEKYLNKCIDSILKQTFQDFELILVDDGSPDKCPKICDEYAKKDKRVRVIHKENLAYALKVKISNLQKMAETLVWVQENNINDLTELNDLCKTAQANAQAAYERLSQAEDELYKINEQIHYAGQYLSTKEVQQQFTKAILKKKFRAEYSKELDAYAESVKYFREENDGKLPSLKSLKKRKEELTQEIAERKKAYAPLREESRRLEIASDNVYGIFRKTNEMNSDLAWKREWEANVREKARQKQARREQRERQPKRKKRSYDMSL